MSRPYPRYRDSGVEWLRDIPHHWGLRQLGRMGSFFKGGGGTKADEVEHGLPCVRYGDLYTQHQFSIRRTRSHIAGASVDSYRQLQYGDLLFAGSGETLEEIGKSAVNLIREPVYCGGDVIVFSPSIKVDAAFLGYAGDCHSSIYQKARMGRGVTVMHIYSSELKHLLIPLPPLPEQQAIASFLDRRTAEIDTLIGSKRQLIERLAEYRTALVTRTVTRGLPPKEAAAAGLDPNPPMRDSEVAWLGEVPEHWETCPTRRRFDIVNGGTPKSGIAEYWDGSTVWITPDDLGRNGRAWISEGRRNITENGVANSGAHISPAGSIVLSTRAPIGHLAILAAPAATNQGCRTLVPSPAMDSRFAYYSFSASRPVIQSLGKGSTFMELPASDLGDHPIPLPPLAEQRAIAECLDRGTAEIDALCGQVETAIERLQEYRTALVTAAVTGKIDVRGAVQAETEGCAV